MFRGALSHNPLRRLFLTLPWLCKVTLPLLCFLWMAGLAQAQSKLSMRHTPPEKAYIGKPLTLNGQVPNNDDLEDVFLYYRVKGKGSFQRLRMSLYNGEFYRATLPANLSTAAGIEYYVVGLDTQKKALPLLASEKQPKVLLPKPAPESSGSSKKDDETEIPRVGDDELVFSAGRREQQSQKAPGVISVITEAEIRAFGFRDVVELLRYMTGMDVNNNGLSPDIGIRGVNPRQSFGDKLVLLVDGQNMAWRQLNRNSAFTSIDNIKQIEIIRGPGSTLWGANALSGVINIITKTGQGMKGLEAIAGGSPLSRSYFFTAQGGGEVIGGLSFRASFSLFRDDRWRVMAPVAEFMRLSDDDYKKLNNINDFQRILNGLPSRYPGLDHRRIQYFSEGEQETTQHFMAQLSWKGLSLSFYQSRYDATSTMGSFSILGGDDTRIVADRFITRLSYLTQLGSWGSLLVWASHDHYGFAPGAQYEANPMSVNRSASQLDGLSGTFLLNQNGARSYYPLCNILPPNASSPCLRVIPRGTERVCQLYNSPQESLNPDAQPSATAPVGAACAPTYTDGRFTRQLAGVDNRFEIGAQLTAQIGQNFGINFGVEFEYLNLLQLYFPDIWQSVLGLELPYIDNIHFSTFLQLQYNLLNFVEFTVGARFDYDQQYGFVITPRAAAVITPGRGFFIKVLYGNAFKAPSFQDLYYWRRNETYGNPELRPEAVHTMELQVGWFRNRLMAVSINGYVSLFERLIEYVQRDANQPLDGLSGIDEATAKRLFPESQRPDGSKNYAQKQNSQTLTTYGGELEFRIFPINGLNIRGNFGVYLGQDNEGNALKYAANWTGSLSASYRYRFFSIALGALVVGPKAVDPRAVIAPGVLPGNASTGGQPVMMPFWTTTRELEDRYKNSQMPVDLPIDPTLEAPMYVNSFMTVQFLDIFGHLDFVIRLSNLLNLDIYDASDLLLIPQKRFDLMAWIRVKY